MVNGHGCIHVYNYMGGSGRQMEEWMDGVTPDAWKTKHRCDGIFRAGRRGERREVSWFLHVVVMPQLALVLGPLRVSHDPLCRAAVFSRNSGFRHCPPE